MNKKKRENHFLKVLTERRQSLIGVKVVGIEREEETQLSIKRDDATT